MFNKFSSRMIAALFYVLMTDVSAQGLVTEPMQMQGNAMQETYPLGQEMAPPPPGPYQVDPAPESANIYYDMHETMPSTEQQQPHSGYIAPQYPDAQMPDSYGQAYYPPPMPAPGGHYPQSGGYYDNAYPPPYPRHAPYSQPQYPYPYGPQ